MCKSAASSATTVALAFAFALAVAGAAVGRTQAASITLNAILDSDQEVPAPTGVADVWLGFFRATVSRTSLGAVMEWKLEFMDSTGTVEAAHIHLGAQGQVGAVAVALCGPCESPARGTTNVDAAVLGALQTGGAYVNVHTPTNTAGAIRGQIAVFANPSTVLTASQAVPKPTGSVGRAWGKLTAVVEKLGSTGTITWTLKFRRLSGRALAAHIHLGARGKTGPVVVTLCGPPSSRPCLSGMGQATPQRLSARVLAAFEAGHAYVNVHTVRNPGGELRGQIAALPFRITP